MSQDIVKAMSDLETSFSFGGGGGRNSGGSNSSANSRPTSTARYSADYAARTGWGRNRQSTQSFVSNLNSFAGDALVGRPGDGADMGVLSDALRGSNVGGGVRGGGGGGRGGGGK